MYGKAQGSTISQPDTAKFAETVRSLRDLFKTESDIYITRAPGRLDVMGGIADYSGSLVLEMPIAEAAHVAIQKKDERELTIVSLGGDENARTHRFEMPLSDFFRNAGPISYSTAREYFRRDSSESWAAYIAGAFLVLMREKGVMFDHGATILIDSKVPEGKGVSSSAAIEVASMNAIAAAFGLTIEGRELAILCQKVENLIVGAPCGIMDQMSSAAGKADELLSMICQPAEVLGTVGIPGEIAFWGIDSGIRHSVGAGDYGSVRIGAFIGYRIIADLAGLKVSEAEKEGFVQVEDTKWNGYLANISPAEFEEVYARHLPKKIFGRDFLSHYGGITDVVTSVQPDKEYAVLDATRHPIYENARVHKFADLLNDPSPDLDALGHLMYESHESYSACGLGTDGTDLIVELVEASPNLFGAKITGGGSGGTVAVLGSKGAEAEVERVVSDYERQTGYRPYIFSASSIGAAAFGYVKVSL